MKIKKEVKEEKIIIKEDTKVDNKDNEIVGIITLEDLFESLLKIHFKDEHELIRKIIRQLTI